MNQVWADTILLNNGESHEGKIIFEDDTYCLLEIQASKTIKDEKKFLKSEIKSITKKTPDLEAFEQLKKMFPAPDLLEVKEYEERIKQAVDFIKDFPKSEQLEEVKQIHEELESELGIISSGGVKFFGKMVTTEEYLANAYAYDQLIAVEKIHREIAQRNFLGALRLFSDYELKFTDGASREELVIKMKQVLLTYKMSLSDSLASYDSRMEKREIGLSRMVAEDRQQTERAQEQQRVNLKARFDSEKSTKNMWITPDSNFKESLVEALRQVENEIKRLSTPPKNEITLVSLEDSYREAWQQLPQASPDEQKTIMEKLKRERMSEYYMTKLSARVSPQ